MSQNPRQINVLKGLAILVSVAALAIGGMLLPRMSSDPYSQQQPRNLALADKFVRAISTTLQTDARFRDVKPQTVTASGGAVLIDGLVMSKDDLGELKRIVQEHQPPITVLFQVSVGSKENVETFELHLSKDKQ